MQLFLASILSCTALLVGVLAQTDWKPYSSPEGALASVSNEARLFTGLESMFDGNPIEVLASRVGYDRVAKTPATEKVFDRTLNASIRQRETKLLTESSSLLARNKGSAITFSDSNGRSIDMDFDMDEHSLEMLAIGLSKGKLQNAKKLFSAVTAIAEREMRKDLVRTGRPDRRDAKRELKDVPCIDGVNTSEPVDAKRDPGNEYIRVDRVERTDRSNQ